MSDTSDPVSAQNRPHLPLPVEPTDDELTRLDALGCGPIEVRHCRGDDSRLRFAIQLCALRAHGRFVNNLTAVPMQIANYLGHQLTLPLVHYVEPPGREATDLTPERRVRTFLGMRSLDGSTTTKLER